MTRLASKITAESQFEIRANFMRSQIGMSKRNFNSYDQMCFKETGKYISVSLSAEVERRFAVGFGLKFTLSVVVVPDLLG
jgi:hypothetical protein